MRRALAPPNATSNFTHRSQASPRRRLGRFGMLSLKNEEEGLLHTGCAYFSLLPKAIWVVSDGPISCFYRQEPVMHACGSAAPLCGGCEGRGEWSFRCLENSDERSIALSDLLSPPATSCRIHWLVSKPGNCIRVAIGLRALERKPRGHANLPKKPETSIFGFRASVHTAH